MQITKKAQIHVKKLCGKKENFFGTDAFHHHIVDVVRYSKLLARKTKSNEEVVEIAAWLHDVGSILGHYKDHHVEGAKYAELFLKKLHYPEHKLENVKHCILAHRGSKKIRRKTPEAICVADADGMSHFDEIGSLFKLALVTRRKSTDDAVRFVMKKLEQTYKKLSPSAKKLVGKKLTAVRLLLESQKRK
ncbi:MAG: HD domain-containing protein [Candidatus Jorgensenbacteria bacterium]